MNKLFAVLLLLSYSASGQNLKTKDSLYRLVAAAREDTNAVHLYYKYGDMLEGVNDDSALYYYNKGKLLSRKINYKRGEAAYASQCLSILNNRGQFREALEIAKDALELYKKVGQPRELAVAYLNVGSEWHYLSDFNTAADNYLEAKKYADRANDVDMLRKATNNLASVFLSLAQFEKGRQYAQKGLEYAQQLKDETAISSTMYNLATAEVYLKRYDTALVLFEGIEAMARRRKDDVGYLDAWLGKAGAYSGLNRNREAIYYFDKVIALATQKQGPEYEMYSYMGKADVHIKENNYAPANEAIQKGLALARRLETKYELKDLLNKGAQLYEQTGNYKDALAYQKQAQILNDSIIGEKNQVTIANNEAKYEFEKKQTAINGLLAEKQLHQLTIRQQRTVNYVLGVGTAMVLLLSFLIYRNVKNKQKLDRQRINELEREKKLTATEAIIKGEEQERSRLAKDLHDGLGGMLSGVKYTLSNMKGNMILTEKYATAFEHSISMLDNSITEMRRVAHNMMPESLMKFGLDEALRDFCKQVTISGVLSVSYQSFGLESKPVEHSLAITVFRVVQELLNNAIKHAAAKRVIVQVTQEEAQLTVTVEDDGKGMDMELLKTAKGIGWKNIISRLDYHNGKLNVQSSPENGTSVFIEFTT